MTLYKTLTEKEVLEAVATIVGMSLPEEYIDKNYEINVSFGDDYSVDIYLIDLDNPIN